MEEIQRIKEIAKNIEGWLTDAEGELLYNLARNCRKDKSVIVEIGSWKGKSTAWLARGSIAGLKLSVFSIDPHKGSKEYPSDKNVDTFREFQENMKKAGTEDIVTPILAASEEVAQDFNKTIELLFIDGAHDYESVKKDFELWSPKLINGGAIVFHDSVLLPGVARVVKEFLYNSNNFYQVGFIHSSTHARKIHHNTLRDRVRNKYILFLKDIYALSTKIYIPSLLKNMLGNAMRRIIN